MEDAGSDSAVEGAAPPPIGVIRVRVDMQLMGKTWDYDLVADDVPSKPYVQHGKIEVPYGPQTTIEFKLQGSASGKLDFKESDPFWVQDGSCPSARCSDPDICIVDVKKNKLTINDRNTRQAELHYQLNFVDKDGNEFEWDPIIRNGGGGP